MLNVRKTMLGYTVQEVSERRIIQRTIQPEKGLITAVYRLKVLESGGSYGRDKRVACPDLLSGSQEARHLPIRAVSREWLCDIGRKFRKSSSDIASADEKIEYSEAVSVRMFLILLPIFPNKMQKR